MLCNNRLVGRKGECRNLMQESLDSIGRVTWICHKCDWWKSGLCWECGKTREKTKLLCSKCRVLNLKLAKARHAKTEQYKKTSAEYFKKRSKDPLFKERRAERKKEWDKKNPHKIVEYKLSRIYKELQRDARKA